LRFAFTILGTAHGVDGLVALMDYPWLLAVGLFFLIFIALEIGYRLAARTRVNSDGEKHEQILSMRDALLVLLSFMLGFTFAMAVSRYDLRVRLMIDEADAISATSLRARMLSEAQQASLLDLLRRYADARTELYDAGLDARRRQAAQEQSKQLQDQLWDTSVAVSRQDRSSVFAEFMLSLNQTISLDVKRRAAMEDRIPGVIWCLIIFIALLSAFALGYSLHQRFWFAAVALPFTLSVVIAMIADLDAPSSGFTGTGHETMLRLQQDLHRKR
jgi:uncharacterized membrane protein YbjE (DUF340 family)